MYRDIEKLDKLKNKADSNRKPSKFLFFAAISALLGGVAMGMVLGWTSPAFEDMEREDSKPHLTNSDSDKNTKSWIGSSMTLGALVGALSSGPIAHSCGRKLALIFYGFPLSLGWFVLSKANSVTTLIIGRVITGIGTGLVSGTSPTYVVEISTDNIRGFMGTSFQVCITIGVLLVYILGSFLTWNVLALVALTPGILMTCLMIEMPETPIWLLTNSQTNRAKTALAVLRHRDNDNDEELEELMEEAESSREGFKIAYIKKREAYLPFFLAIGIMFFEQFSGYYAVIFYTISILKESGSTLKPKYAIIIVGIAQVFATISASFLVDRIGRKVLLIISGAGHSISLGIMGFYYFFFAERESNWGWLPVVCLVLYIVSFSVGFGPISWLMINEMTPIYARSFISAIATAVNWLCAFAITKNFEWLQQFADKHGAFFIFTCICLISIAFVLAFLPETKGKSLEEIRRWFSDETDQKPQPKRNTYSPERNDNDIINNPENTATNANVDDDDSEETQKL